MTSQLQDRDSSIPKSRVVLVQPQCLPLLRLNRRRRNENALVFVFGSCCYRIAERRSAVQCLSAPIRQLLGLP